MTQPTSPWTGSKRNWHTWRNNIHAHLGIPDNRTLADYRTRVLQTAADHYKETHEDGDHGAWLPHQIVSAELERRIAEATEYEATA